ncbi:MAG: hypothetical protein K5640_08710 [Treponema sp.]|nr:hypothetical protein [Treponema sp.]
MLQFYFLSILLNLLTGLVLLYANIFSEDQKAEVHSEKTEKATGKIKELISNTAFFENKTFLLVVGILATFTGLMKLLSVVRNDIPVIGDLLPALAGLFGGFTVVLAYYLMTATEPLGLPDFVHNIFIKGHKYIGIFCIVAALLHFVFPGALFF